MIPRDPNSIVFLACHWVGDTFWASQVVARVLARYPAAIPVVYTKPGCMDLWRGLMPPERVRPAPFITSDRHREPVTLTILARQALAARRERHDWLVDLTGNRYSALFTRLAGPKWALGFAGGGLGRWAYDERVRMPPSEHLAYRPWRVGAPLLGAFTPHDPRPLATLPEDYAAVAAANGLDPHRPVLVIAPGSGWPAKEWAPAHFREVAQRATRQGVQVAVCGGGGQQELCATVAAGGEAGMTRQVVGWPLGRVMALLSGCSAVLGNDSGLGHLAAAYGRPVLSLFTGATDPRLCAPLGPVVTILNTQSPATTAERVAGWVMNAILEAESLPA